MCTNPCQVNVQMPAHHLLVWLTINNYWEYTWRHKALIWSKAKPRWGWSHFLASLLLYAAFCSLAGVKSFSFSSSTTRTNQWAQWQSKRRWTLRHLAKLLLWEDSGHFVAQCSSGLSEDAERSLLSAERLPVIYLTLDGGSFRVQLKVVGKSYVLGSQKGRLKIHAWSNICISIDGISGHLKAVVDGYSLESLSSEWAQN